MLVIGEDDREWSNFCGATLITNQYAMSALHCFTQQIAEILKHPDFDTLNMGCRVF